MATFSTTNKTYVESDANFRTLLGFIRTMFTNFGWVQTSDSGQINPATVTYPGSNNSDAGYEVWRMADSLQSSFPVYVKIFYGRGGANGAFRINLGISMSVTDGSGNFTGIASSGPAFAVTGNPSTRPISDATSFRIFGSGDTNRMVFSFWPDVVNQAYGCLFGIERTKDGNGADTGEGIVAIWNAFGGNNTSTNSNDWSQLTIPFNLTYTPAFIGSNQSGVAGTFRSLGSGLGGATARSGQDSGSTLHKGKVYAYPYFPLGSVSKYPLMNALVVVAADWPVDYSNVTIPFYGANHIYMPLGVGPTVVNGPFRQGSNLGFLMRYE